MYLIDPTSATCWNRALIKVCFAIAVVVALWGVFYAEAIAQSGGGEANRPPAAYDEAEAQAIDRMLMCPVCPAESIDQAQVPLARQMRAQVRQLLGDGASRDEVLDWFKARYGPGIVAEPPRSGFNLIAWIVPGVALIAGLAGGVMALRAMRRRADVETDSNLADVDPALQPYLAAVDRDLALDAGDREARNDG